MNRQAIQPNHGPATGANSAFSLVEVAIALGIVAFALLSVLGLIQVGVTSLKGSVDETVTSLILHDVKTRLAGTPFTARTLSPMYYDGNCLLLSAANQPQAKYRVDVTVGAPTTQPTGTTVDSLRAAIVTIGWPVVGSTMPTGSGGSHLTVSFFVAPTTAPAWTSTAYQPKIDL